MVDFSELLRKQHESWHREGWDAMMNGWPSHNNPYATDSTAFIKWHHGWVDAAAQVENFKDAYDR